MVVTVATLDGIVRGSVDGDSLSMRQRGGDGDVIDGSIALSLLGQKLHRAVPASDAVDFLSPDEIIEIKQTLYSKKQELEEKINWRVVCASWAYLVVIHHFNGESD
jgi:hypothetical protein